MAGDALIVVIKKLSDVVIEIRPEHFFVLGILLALDDVEELARLVFVDLLAAPLVDDLLLDLVNRRFEVEGAALLSDNPDED